MLNLLRGWDAGFLKELLFFSVLDYASQEIYRIEFIKPRLYVSRPSLGRGQG